MAIIFQGISEYNKIMYLIFQRLNYMNTDYSIPKDYSHSLLILE